MVFIFTLSLLGCKSLQFLYFAQTTLKHCLQCRCSHIKPSCWHLTNSKETGHIEGKDYLSNSSGLLYDEMNALLGTHQHINTMQRSGAGTDNRSVGKASVTVLRGKGELRLTVVSQGDEVRKTKRGSNCCRRQVPLCLVSTKSQQ